MKKADRPDVEVTARNVSSVPAPPSGRWKYHAAGPTGFRLIVSATGARTWALEYRSRVGVGRVFTIGSVDDFSYGEAKAQAEELRGVVAKGGDPFEDLTHKRTAARTATNVLTVEGAFDLHLRLEKGLEERTREAYRQTVAKLPPAFMRRPVESVSVSDVRAALEAATNGPVMANRILSKIKAAFRHAHREGQLPILPAVVEMERPSDEQPRERTLSRAEIRTLWLALDAIEKRMPRGGPSVAASVKIMLLVGTRHGETGFAEWSEFDLDGTSPRSDLVPAGVPLWYIPADHRKKVGKRFDFWTPLPPAAVAILKKLREYTGDKPRVFWKAGETMRSYAMVAILEEMSERGQKEPWSYHDLRRTCQTGLSELRCPQDLANFITGHAKKGMARIYDRAERIEERAEWLGKWAARVEEIVGLA